MSGRPRNPTYVVEAFAPDVSYPPGSMPYNGTATRVPWSGAASVGFVPRQAVPAQSINYLFHAASVNDQSAKEAISTLTNFVGQTPALTFPHVQSSADARTFAAYDPSSKQWYVCANGKKVFATRDFCATAFGANEVAAVGAGSEDCTWIDVDTSGNVVVATSTRYAFEKTASTGVWTRVDVAGGSISASSYAIAYDPVRAKWIWAGQNVDASNARVMTSTDRTTWTSGSGALLPNASIRNLVCKKSSGLVMFAGVNTSTGKISTTSNGATSWTNHPDLAFGFTPQDAHLSYDADNDAWFFVVSRYTGGYQSEVWRSTNDGAAWTKICTLANSRLLRIAPLGSMLVSVANNPSIPGQTVNDGEVVFSLDDGATWLPAGFRPQGPPLGVFTGPNVGGVLLLGLTYVYHSARMGMPTWAALT